MPSNIELYLNGNLMDLSDDTVIALTKQINDIRNPSDSFGDLSNQFNLPFTAINDSVLGISRRVESSSTVPYTKIQAKLIDNGVEIIPDGYAYVSTADDSYNVTVYANNSDFFESIRGKKLNELDYSDYSHEWELNNIVDSRTNTTIYKYSLIDYGLMPPAGTHVRADELFPCFFINELMKRTVEAAGWTLEGDVLSDERYNKLKLDFSLDTWERPESEMALYRVNTVASEQNFSYIRDSESGIPALYYPFRIVFEDNNVMQSDLYNTLHDVRINFNTQVTIDYAFAGNATGDNGEIKLVIWNITQNTLVSEWTVFIFQGTDISLFPSGSYGRGTNTIVVNDFIFPDGNLPFPNYFSNEGDQLEIRLDVTAEFDLDLTVELTELTIEANKPIWINEYYILQNQLPDITQVDFMKGIMGVFGVIPDSKGYNKTLVLRSYNEIKENLKSVDDWSDIYSETGNDPIELHPDGAAQRNFFEWDNDRTTPEGLGESYFDIADTSLESEATTIRLPFGSSEMVKRLNGLDVPLIKKIDYGEAPEFPTGIYNGSPIPPPFVETVVTLPPELNLDSTSLRLSIDDTRTILIGIIYTDALSNQILVSDNLPFCYFSLPAKDLNLGFEYLMPDYYESYIQLFNNYKKIFPNFTLNPLQLQNFDHLKPIYIAKYSGNFLAMKINNYKNGQTTQVDLIKL